jgi:hypothetical protein
MTLAAVADLATLGQTQGVGAPPESLAAELAHAAHNVGSTLQGLAEHTQDGGHCST